jgi:hypothetical protein
MTVEHLIKQHEPSANGQRMRHNAYERLILPHVDLDIAKEVFEEGWLKLAPQ